MMETQEKRVNNSEQLNEFPKPEDDYGKGEPKEVVVKITEYVTKGNVIEFGAHWGRHSRYLAKASPEFHVVATDVDDEALEVLQHFASQEHLTNIETKVMDAREGLREDYDVVVCTFMLHLLSPAQAREFFENIKQHTRPGGLHAIVTWTNKGDAYNISDGSHFFPAPSELKAIYQDWELLEWKEEERRVRENQRMHMAVELLVRKKKDMR